MEKRFQKNSREMMMFRDFFELIQKFWYVEPWESYWDPFIDETIAFERKYQDIPLARQLVNAFTNTQERMMKDGNTV